MTEKRNIEPSDIMDLALYAQQRGEYRQKMIALKKNRRVAVGPFVTCLFENFDTMLYQVHEMLYIEKGGKEQIDEELKAYNPLIGKGNTLSATMMIDITNPQKREKELARLGGIEETCSLLVGEEKIAAQYENDVDRTTPEGKTSSIHFLSFRLSSTQSDNVRKGIKTRIAIEHDHYSHMAVIAADVLAEIARDL